MNAEELKDLAAEMLRDVESTSRLTQLQQLENALAQSIAQPAEPSFQAQVNDARVNLLSALQAAPSVDWPPRWVDLARELGVDDMRAPVVAEVIEEVFARNQITPQVVHETVQSLANRVSDYESQLRNLLSALDFLQVPSYGLGPGEFEATLSIPRGAVDNSLGGLGQEFKVLDSIILPFVELVTGGSRPPVELRAIASSDFEAFVSLLPQAAEWLSLAIDRVLTIYERIQVIREKRKELKDAGLPDEDLAPIEQRANQLMTEEIPRIVEEIMAGVGSLPADGRTHELTADLTRSVTNIASRVDVGFRITVRTGPPLDDVSEPGDEDAASPSDPALERSRQVVLENQRRAQYHELVGEPILELPSFTDDDGA